MLGNGAHTEHTHPEMGGGRQLGLQRKVRSDRTWVPVLDSTVPGHRMRDRFQHRTERADFGDRSRRSVRSVRPFATSHDRAARDLVDLAPRLQPEAAVIVSTLNNGIYQEVDSATAGATTTRTSPCPVTLDPAELTSQT